MLGGQYPPLIPEHTYTFLLRMPRLKGPDSIFPGPFPTAVFVASNLDDEVRISPLSRHTADLLLLTTKVVNPLNSVLPSCSATHYPSRSDASFLSNTQTAGRQGWDGRLYFPIAGCVFSFTTGKKAAFYFLSGWQASVFFRGIPSCHLRTPCSLDFYLFKL